MLTINPKYKPGYIDYHWVAGSLIHELESLPPPRVSRVHAGGGWKCMRIKGGSVI